MRTNSIAVSLYRESERDQARGLASPCEMYALHSPTNRILISALQQDEIFLRILFLEVRILQCMSCTLRIMLLFHVIPIYSNQWQLR